jgi:hypothetical protein
MLLATGVAYSTCTNDETKHVARVFFIFIVAPCILKIHLLPHQQMH